MNLVRKELAWLRRGPPARTSKPKFRIEAAQALIADEPPARDSMALKGFAARRLGKTVYDVEDVDYAVPTDDGPRTLFKDLTWHVGPGDRIGIVGVNGAGKTSLLKLLVGETKPDAGDGRRRPDRRAGLPVPARHRAAAARPGAGGGAGRRPHRADRQPGDLGVDPGRAVRLRRQPAVDAGRRPLRRRAAAAAAAAAADGRAERAGARRAHQRPRHRHPHRAGGPARQLPRHGAGGQPRPVLRRPGLRQGRRAARRRHAGRAARRGGGVPAPPGRRRCAADHGGRRRRHPPGRAAVDLGARRSPRRMRGRRRRRRAGWSGGCSSWTPTRRSCTSSSPPRPPTTRRRRSSTPQLKAVHAEKEQVEDEWLAATELAEG